MISFKAHKTFDIMTFIIQYLQMKKLKLSEFKSLSQGNRAIKW